jgi:D-sedoheptulose 7-phosphate isomerase
MEEPIRAYFSRLHACVTEAVCTGPEGRSLTRRDGFDRAARLMRNATSGDNKIMFIGNGGSAGIASHAAIDFSKNGGMRSMALNDGAALTCLGNDLGYEQVFATQIGFHGRRGDVLVAISSSGQSANILEAVRVARRIGCAVVTYSGFQPDNPLRALGDVNFHIAAGEYGFVEVGHLALIHALLDLTMSGVLAARDAKPLLSTAGR